MKRTLLIACVCGVATLSACGSDDDGNTNNGTETELVNPNEAVAAPREAIEVNSTDACAIDVDCAAGSYCFQGICASECSDDAACGNGEACDDRGRCTTGQGLTVTRTQALAAAPDVIPGLRIAGTPETVFYLTPGQTAVEVTLPLNADGPDNGIAYIARRSDLEGSGSVVQRMRANGKTATFTLEAGAASPDSEDPRPIRVELVSAVGSMTIALVPEQSAAGTYAGEVRLATFGSSGLPIEFEIITEPEGAALSQATSAHVVLPLKEHFIFAPGRGESAPEEAVAALEYDDFTDSWVANFRGAFDLTDGVVLRSPAATQVDRKLRLEINVSPNGDVSGQFRDIWTGLYESRSADGVITREDVNFEGEVLATKTGKSRSASDVDTSAMLPTPNTQALGAPDLAICAFDLSGYSGTIEANVYDCAGLTDAASFEAASAEAQATCALAVSATGLAGDTTASQIQTYLDGGDLGGRSFAEFMADCSTGANGTCRPSTEVTCARQLLASAYRTQASDSVYVGPLLDQYLETTREQSLGAQFGSLQSDTETRLEWLKSTEYPSIATAQVRDLNERLLNEWQTNVLDVHFAVLRNQFDTAGLIALSREPEGQAGIEARGELLLEMNQSFRTALESLTIATRRWDVLYTAADKRREKAAYVATRARDLYMLAGVLQNLNLAGGTGFLSAGIGSGFGALQRELERLSLPFNELIYSRDAEVTVSTSVDPTVSNQTLLGQLETKAREDIETALTTVTQVVAQDQTEALSETELRNRLNNEVDDLKTDLVTLCGIPRDCSVADVFETDECRVQVNGGQCGFVFERGSDEIAPDFSVADLAASDGGTALLALLESANNVRIANAEVLELRNRVSLKRQQTAAFVGRISERSEIMEDKIRSMGNAFAELAANRTDEIGDLSNNIAMRASMRADAVSGDRSDLAAWTGIRFGSITGQMGLEIGALTTGRIADGLDRSAEAVLTAGDAAKDALPQSAEDIPSAATRLAIGAAAVNSAAALSASAFSLQTVSESLALAAEQVSRYSEATLENLMANAEINNQEGDDAITALIEGAKLAGIENAAEREAIQNALTLANEEREIRLAQIRDRQELDDRRAEILAEMTKLAGLNLRVAQARIQYQQRLMDYGTVVQRAQLVDAKLNELVSQRQNVNLIVGSPTAVFSRTNRIVRAENKLEMAKDSLMDWLVALEYYAVRPFMDQRIQILLARNPYQLEEIADEMLRLQGACGGSINNYTAELSLRDDFLTITQPQQDLDGAVLEPNQVFRELLNTGYVPIDKRTRYTTDENVGSLLKRSDEVLAASFYVDLSDFANLEATCNAKLASLDIQLVGEIGEARPTVSILYDGTGELRSCQPGIDSYVAQFGEGTTSFGSVTYLRSAGRSISPVAGINAFIEDSSNTTLNGLPLSSQYTVLIDTSIGENGNVDWSKLEDIRMRVSYTYQDIFPEGQCE